MNFAAFVIVVVYMLGGDEPTTVVLPNTVWATLEECEQIRAAMSSADVSKETLAGRPVLVSQTTCMGIDDSFKRQLLRKIGS